MKVLLITQARIGSTRLPAKVLKTIGDKTLLEIHLLRAAKAKNVSKIIVATTTEDGVEAIAKIANQLNIETYFGSTYDVLDRFYNAAVKEQPDYVVRITSDCPLIDPDIIDHIIERIINSDADYAANIINLTYPDGVDTEVFKFSALEKAFHEAVDKYDREHVTPYIRRNSTLAGGNIFKSISIENEKDLSHIRITVDTPADFELVTELVENLGYEKPWLDYVDYLTNKKSVA